MRSSKLISCLLLIWCLCQSALLLAGSNLDLTQSSDQEVITSCHGSDTAMPADHDMSGSDDSSHMSAAGCDMPGQCCAVGCSALFAAPAPETASVTPTAILPFSSLVFYPAHADTLFRPPIAA